MVLAILTTLWFSIAVCIFVLSTRTPKGRSILRVLWRSRKVRIMAILPFVIVLAIALVFIFQPAVTETEVDHEKFFAEYSRTIVEAMQSQGAITIDTACSLDAPQPELAYTMPALVSVYNAVVNRPTTPRLVQLDDKLRLSFDGYKQFKNRTINIMKGVRKRLGPRYTVDMESHGENHELIITYKGTAWNNEQLCALPAKEAGIREKVDPALLMSIVRHTSDFDFNFQRNKRDRRNGERGLLALDSGEGLEQIFIGAKKLHAALDTAKNTEDAVAAFYPVHDMETMHSEWRKSPLKSSWVNEVLSDVQYYRNNGLE